MDCYTRTRHSVYMLTYHMIFVTKWRKKVISNDVGDFMVSTAGRLCAGYGGRLISAVSFTGTRRFGLPLTSWPQQGLFR